MDTSHYDLTKQQSLLGKLREKYTDEQIVEMVKQSVLSSLGVEGIKIEKKPRVKLSLKARDMLDRALSRQPIGIPRGDMMYIAITSVIAMTRHAPDLAILQRYRRYVEHMYYKLDIDL